LLVSGDSHHAEALREEVSAILTPVGLRLAPEKTHVVHIDEGFDFLGFHIRRMRKRGTNKYHVYTTPSRKSVQKVRDRVRDKTCRSTLNTDLDELIAGLNQSLRGWANYFRHGVSKATFDTIDRSTTTRGCDWSDGYTANTATSTGNSSDVASVTGAGGSPTMGSSSPAPPASR
jgi:RNA-directed DNA polymerase